MNPANGDTFFNPTPGGGAGSGTGVGTDSYGYLGMYISPSGPNAFDTAAAWAGGSVTRGSGFGVTDTAGQAPPGTVSPGFKTVTGGGGIAGTYNASRFVPPNQALLFSGFFNLARDSVTMGSITGLPGASAASLSNDSYLFGGSALYRTGATYLRGTAMVVFGDGDETQTVDGSTGNFRTSGYAVDARLGHIFELWNTTGSAAPSIVTKAPPPKPADYVVGLDLSGHLGYYDLKVASFTDSTGFVFGDDRTHYSQIGARAQLFTIVPAYGWLWKPYVAETLDHQIGFSSTLLIPNQALFPGGDVISTLVAQNFWGTEFGLDVRPNNGWIVGAKGFYTASADVNVVGGAAYIKIPFNSMPFVRPRY